jgi:hypothetical protein
MGQENFFFIVFRNSMHSRFSFTGSKASTLFDISIRFSGSPVTSKQWNSST